MPGLLERAQHADTHRSGLEHPLDPRRVRSDELLDETLRHRSDKLAGHGTRNVHVRANRQRFRPRGGSVRVGAGARDAVDLEHIALSTHQLECSAAVRPSFWYGLMSRLTRICLESASKPRSSAFGLCRWAMSGTVGGGASGNTIRMSGLR